MRLEDCCPAISSLYEEKISVSDDDITLSACVKIIVLTRLHNTERRDREDKGAHKRQTQASPQAKDPSDPASCKIQAS